MSMKRLGKLCEVIPKIDGQAERDDCSYADITKCRCFGMDVLMVKI